MKFQKLVLILVFVLISLSNVVASSVSNAVPVSETIVRNNSTFLVDGWDELPFKHLKANKSWVEYVNTNYDPSPNWITILYDENNEKISPKCLSYSAATVADWFSLETGEVLDTYTSYLNNRIEYGHNPRELEAIYHDRHTFYNTYTYLFFDASVTWEQIPYNLKGYVDILTNPPSDWINVTDPDLGSNYLHTVKPGEYLPGGETENLKRSIPIVSNKEQVQSALERYGILYAHLDSTLVGWDLLGIEFPIHAVTLIGYGNYGGEDVFWIHDTYDRPYVNSSYQDVRYKAIDVFDLDSIYAFFDPTWSTYRHDNRRTGSSTFKGDLSNETSPDDFTFPGDGQTDGLDHPAFADLDGDGYQEIIVGTKNDVLIGNSSEARGRVFAYNFDKQGKDKAWWSTTNEDIGLYLPVIGTPTVADLNNDGNKEVIFGDTYGRMWVLNNKGDKL
ncbi:MAG: VCBS repeat-containing protein [Nanoarchaeota archaeon]|nr:VCBS repeat-containing protein [DPANN group archaeon]MBL7116825.1 VCBS repeat-containing protein [Nanoarchaeota archaeon]